jgi:hypothetical protein
MKKHKLCTIVHLEPYSLVSSVRKRIYVSKIRGNKFVISSNYINEVEFNVVMFGCVWSAF